MAGEVEGVIMEEREEEMISPTGGYPTYRTAHFLKPSIITAPDPPPPITAFAGGSQPPLKVTHRGWKNADKNWVNWVESMRVLHESAWREAGIFESIMNSKCKIHRSNGLILTLAGKWCSETNTFLFPWGEATLTLEDMAVLGGFSVSGCSVHPNLSPKSYQGSEATVQRLIDARRDVYYSSEVGRVTQQSWSRKFMNSGSEIEHEAFLVHWLERFVFPKSSQNSITCRMLDMAVLLARGETIALAPAVLASIYRNLTLLRNARDRGGEIVISAPFQFVKIWAWERFLELRPNSNVVQHQEEPRFARWDEVKMEADKNAVAMAVDDSDGDIFLWRPYTIGAKDSGFPKEIDELAKWLRVSEVVGIEDCIEQYLPHRVAMQFGFDQDIPGNVSRVNRSPEAAWEFFTRPVLESELYVPPRSFESDVTTRYLDWWKKSKCCRTSDDNNALSDNDDGDITLSQLVKKRKILKSCTNLQTNVARTCNNTTQPENRDISSLKETNETSKIQEDCVEAKNPPENQDISEDRLRENNGTSKIQEDCVDAKNLPGKRRCKVDRRDLEVRISNLEKIFVSIRKK